MAEWERKRSNRIEGALLNRTEVMETWTSSTRNGSGTRRYLCSRDGGVWQQDGITYHGRESQEALGLVFDGPGSSADRAPSESPPVGRYGAPWDRPDQRVSGLGVRHRPIVRSCGRR